MTVDSSTPRQTPTETQVHPSNLAQPAQHCSRRQWECSVATEPISQIEYAAFECIIAFSVVHRETNHPHRELASLTVAIVDSRERRTIERVSLG